MRTLSPYFLEVQRKRFPPCICLGTSAQPFSLSEMSQDQGYQFWGVGTLVPPAPWQWAAWGGPTALSALTGTSYFHSPRTLPCHAKLLRSCPTLCEPTDCSPPGSSVHGDSPGKNTGVGCYVLLQGIFLTQGSNLLLSCLLRWQVGSLPLVPPGSPRRTLFSTNKQANLMHTNKFLVTFPK